VLPTVPSRFLLANQQRQETTHVVSIKNRSTVAVLLVIVKICRAHCIDTSMNRNVDIAL
jgi:hypothetical protein